MACSATESLELCTTCAILLPDINTPISASHGRISRCSWCNEMRVMDHTSDEFITQDGLGDLVTTPAFDYPQLDTSAAQSSINSVMPSNKAVDASSQAHNIPSETFTTGAMDMSGLEALQEPEGLFRPQVPVPTSPRRGLQVPQDNSSWNYASAFLAPQLTQTNDIGFSHLTMPNQQNLQFTQDTSSWIFGNNSLALNTGYASHPLIYSQISPSLFNTMAQQNFQPFGSMATQQGFHVAPSNFWLAQGAVMPAPALNTAPAMATAPAAPAAPAPVAAKPEPAPKHQRFPRGKNWRDNKATPKQIQAQRDAGVPDHEINYYRDPSEVKRRAPRKPKAKNDSTSSQK